MMDDESRAVCSLFIKELATSIRDISMAVHELTDELHEHKLTIQKLHAEVNAARDQAEDLRQAVAKLNIMVRDGNGQPSLVTRVSVLEQHCKDADARREKEERAIAERRLMDSTEIQTNKQIKWAVITAVITGVLGIFSGVAATVWSYVTNK